MVEKAGQIGLTRFVIKFRFAAWSNKNSKQEQIINNPFQHLEEERIL